MITDEQIRKLRSESLAASDYRMIDMCNRALVADDDTLDSDGNPIAYADWPQADARALCRTAIENAAAMQPEAE